MSWTRRWGIIASIALAQLGIIVGYQALLSPGPSAAYADETVMPPIAVPTLPPTVANKAPATLPQSGDLPLPAQSNSLPKNEEPPLADVLPPFGIAPRDPQVIPAGANQPPGLPGVPPANNPPQPPATSPLPGGNPLPQPNLVPGPGPDALPPVGAGPLPIAPVVNPQPLPGPAGPLNEVKPTAIPPCPWNLNMEIVEGRTVLTARNGAEVQFKVTCDKLDLQAPRGRMDASGKVKITSDQLEGGCDKLTISWHEDVIVLEKVQLKCKLEGYAAEMQAEQLRLRLSRVIPTTDEGFERPPTRQLMSVPR